MSWSYNTSLTSTKDQVRYLVGDTNALDQQVQDEEIVFSLSQNGGNIYLAAAMVANSLSAKYSNAKDITVDGMSIKNSTRAQSYASLAIQLEAKANTLNGGVAPIVGGLTGRRSFGMRMMDNPFAGKQNIEFTPTHSRSSSNTITTPVITQTALAEITEGLDYVDVVFTTRMSSADYKISTCNVENNYDATPLNLICGIITNKTASGFRQYLSAAADTANYKLRWVITE